MRGCQTSGGVEGNRELHPGLYGLVERLAGAVREIEKRARWAREAALLVHGVGVPGRPDPAMNVAREVGFQVSIA